MRGKWFFTYSWNDTFSGGLAGRIEYEEVPLNASNEEDAIMEGEELWSKKVAEAKLCFENKKKEWHHPPDSPFQDGPWKPSVVYKIPIEQ